MNLRLLLLFICCGQREPSLSNHQRAQPAEAVGVGAGWTDRDFGLPLQRLSSQRMQACLVHLSSGTRRAARKTFYSVFEAALPDINNSFIYN